MNEAINLLTGLGPNALLAGAVLYLWREMERAREREAAALAREMAIQTARLNDAQSNTTKMLELYDRLHPLDDDRRSRND